MYPVDEGCVDASSPALGVGGEVQQRRLIRCGAVSDHTDRHPWCSGDGEEVGHERYVEVVSIR